MFGPFEISMCRRKLKRHIALFICLASRAIHLEVVHEMSTDSFMNALRRFLCRRGHVQSIRSDNGTNFVGAQNELQRQYEWLDKSKLKDLALEHDVDIIEWQPSQGKSHGRNLGASDSICASHLFGYPTRVLACPD